MTTSTSSVLARLDADWAATVTTSRARRALHTWRQHPIHGHLFVDLDGLRAIVETLHASHQAESDPLLTALIDHTQHGDELTGRVILQAFVPLAVTLAKSRRGDAEYLGDVISVLAEMIATFPLDTHPHHLAGHLAFMVRRGLHRRHRRRHLTTVSLDDDAVAAVVDHDYGASHDARASIDRVADIVTESRRAGAIDDDQARTLMLVASGYRVAELARQAGCHRSRMGARVAKATAACQPLAIAA